ncbi:hypothetical protein NW766_008818 [Fusarium irregulare]|uniref:Transmembrane protein n=1 Tax=Fusarium irregulare TaxID=2494466 RepID=A0A9W8PK43_9HYPO|nr:hypothetical protein NW766_008818 [Fusarium irregulare]
MFLKLVAIRRQDDSMAAEIPEDNTRVANIPGPETIDTPSRRAKPEMPEPKPVFPDIPEWSARFLESTSTTTTTITTTADIPTVIFPSIVPPTQTSVRVPSVFITRTAASPQWSTLPDPDENSSATDPRQSTTISEPQPSTTVSGPPKATATATPEQSHSWIGATVGAIVGGLAFLILAYFIVFYACRRYRKKGDKDPAPRPEIVHPFGNVQGSPPRPQRPTVPVYNNPGTAVYRNQTTPEPQDITDAVERDQAAPVPQDPWAPVQREAMSPSRQSVSYFNTDSPSLRGDRRSAWGEAFRAWMRVPDRASRNNEDMSEIGQPAGTYPALINSPAPPSAYSESIYSQNGPPVRPHSSRPLGGNWI